MALTNIDLLLVGISIAGAGTLGYSIYFANPRGATSRAFLFFTTFAMFWSLVNFSSARVIDPHLLIWLIRLVIFCATWFIFALLTLSLQFPSEEPRIPRRIFWSLFAWTVLVSLLALSPYVFRSADTSTAQVRTMTGPGMPIFALTVFSFIGAAIFSLIRKTMKAERDERRRIEWVLAGLAISFAFLATFEFVFPAFLNNPALVPYGGLFLLPFIMCTAYAILRYRIFNPRVALYGVLTFMLATATFFDVLLSDTLAKTLYRVVELVLVLLAGIWLIRSMAREFELERELAAANEQQVVLIHFITHQIKGFVAKSRNIFSLLLEGDYGPVPDTMRPMLEAGFESDTKGAQTIQEILNASNIKSGKVTYKMEPFDLKALIDSIARDLKPAADAKQLAFNVDTGTAPLMFTGDNAQLVNAFKNLIDNSIKYTPKGEVNVRLRQEGKKIVFTIHDTGVGITPEDMKNLFTEGGHGKESVKVNVESTGFGLYIVKNIIVAHKGKVWAESEGAGKGSSFFVELPA